MKLGFFILGKACGRRQEEIGQVRRFFAANDWIEARGAADADAVVFFACAGVRSIVDANVKEIAEVQKKMKPGAELLVGSCLPAMDGPSLGRVFQGRTLTPTDLGALNDLPAIQVRLEALPAIWGRDAASQPLKKLPFRAAARMRIDAAALALVKAALLRRPGPAMKRTALRLQRRVTINLSVAAGCTRRCSYCARPFASGKVRSKPVEVVAENIRRGLRRGYRGFNLYADSIGVYGLDLGATLGDLLDRLDGLGRGFSLGLYDVHAQDFIRFFEPIRRLCRAGKIHYLYVAVQSGNERILDLMRRPCDVEDLAEKLAQVRRYAPVFLQSTVIVGFPGETDAEFQDTLALLKRIGFDDVYVHCYCDMLGTEASGLPSKVDKETIRRRLDEIRAAGIPHDAAETQREWESDLTP